MKNKHIALVTGANRGIGYAVARGLLKKGVTVLITSRNEEKGLKAKKELDGFGEVFYHRLDVTDEQSIQSVADFVDSEFGKLDIVVNNAGINYDTWQNTSDADLTEVRNTFETNVFGPWQIIQTLLPLLKKSNQANIVNVSSGSGALHSQTGNTPGYSLSKLALNGLTLQLANQLKKDQITVNSVCPGWVKTDMGGSEAPRTPEKGAETIIWLALLEDRSATGKFFRDKKEIDW